MTFTRPAPRKSVIPFGRYRPMQWLHEFATAFGKRKFFEEPNEEARIAGVILRRNLIAEEFKEVLDEIQLWLDESPSADLEALAKELADLLYVVYGTAEYFDLPMESVFREVHRSNMTKLGLDGKPVVVAGYSGKFGKGPNYRPADVHGVLTGEWL